MLFPPVTTTRTQMHFRGQQSRLSGSASLNADERYGKRPQSFWSIAALAKPVWKLIAMFALGLIVGSVATYAFLARRARPAWLERLDTFTGVMRGRVFADIARQDKWNNPDSPAEERITVAGPGSSMVYTEAVRAWLGEILANTSTYGPIRSMVDLSCSELAWQTHIPGWDKLDRFSGYDIVGSVVERARARAVAARGDASTPVLQFGVADMVAANEPLPAHDLVLLRDTLMHVPPTDALHALERIDASGSTWLATTTFDDPDGGGGGNVFILPGSWYAVNLRQPPFILGPPISSVLEGRPGVDRYGQKRLAVWKLPVLRAPPLTSLPSVLANATG